MCFRFRSTRGLIFFIRNAQLIFLQVHRVCFALTLFHAILGVSLIGVNNSRSKRAQIQNGWWGPKILAWITLLIACFFIPNEFFMFWGNYIALIGAAFFILFGLMLL